MRRFPAYLVEAIGTSAGLLGTRTEDTPYARQAILGWIETDLMYLEALTDGADGWRWAE